MLLPLLTCIVNLIQINAKEDAFCSRDTCQNNFKYQGNILDWTKDKSTLFKWLESLQDLKSLPQCNFKDDVHLDLTENVRPLKGPFSCRDPSNVNMKVKKNGKVTIERIEGEALSKGHGNNCYSLLPVINKITGTLINGSLHGKANIFYYDEMKMKANFENGVVKGQVLIYDKHEDLRGIGLYENGLPHGPFWLIYENQFINVHFENGKMIEENVIFINNEQKTAVMGKLKNNSKLQEVKEIDLEHGDFKCLKIIRIPTKFANSAVINSEKYVKLPLKVIAAPHEQRIVIRPSKIMYFLRVAKTGTLGFMHLLAQLGLKLDYDVRKNFGGHNGTPYEKLQDTSEGVAKEAQKLVTTHRNLVQCKHYSLFDFEKLGHSWTPEWFSLVRDPIEKVLLSQCEN